VELFKFRFASDGACARGRRRTVHACGGGTGGRGRYESHRRDPNSESRAPNQSTFVQLMMIDGFHSHRTVASFEVARIYHNIYCSNGVW
jgi:hypothetical protein